MTLAPAARRSLIATGSVFALIALLLVLRNVTVADPLDNLLAVQERVDGVTVYEGSWLFPRGGPYMVGFEAPTGRARLFIDGIEIRPDSRGVRREPWRGRRLEDAPNGGRADYAPGVVGVRFEAPPGARLLWIPPGRRSDPEYVPPSSLLPRRPAEARFGTWAGASPADGLFATAIGALLLLWLTYLFRVPLARVERSTWLAFAGVLVFALAVRLYGLGDAGQTWDENTNWSAGRNYITNLLSLDFSQASWRWNYEHPPVMKYIAGVGAQWSDGYGPARVLSALVGSLAVALLVPIGRRLYSLRVGLFAGAIAALTPHIIAHGQIVGHEAPTMLWWTLAVLLCLRVYDGLRSGGDLQTAAERRVLWLRFAGIGVVLGLAIWSRFANLLLAPLIGAMLLYGAPRGTRKRVVLWGLTIIPAVAVLLGVLLWPRLWSTPIAHLIESWDKLKKPHSTEPFLGVITNMPSRAYFVAYLWATTPVVLLVGVAVWFGRAVVRHERAAVMLALWLVAPLLVMASPVRQDGVRYIMPTVLALCLAAAAGFDWSLTRVSPRWRGRAIGGLAGLVLVYLALICARIRPLYLDYYGEQVGGPARVARTHSFEIAWWGEGLSDAIDYINREAPVGARVYKRCISPYDHLGWLRGDLWPKLAPSAAAADWIVVYQPSFAGSAEHASACAVPSSFSLVYERSIQGAAVARVYRRAASPASPPR